METHHARLGVYTNEITIETHRQTAQRIERALSCEFSASKLLVSQPNDRITAGNAQNNALFFFASDGTTASPGLIPIWKIEPKKYSASIDKEETTTFI